MDDNKGTFIATVRVDFEVRVDPGDKNFDIDQRELEDMIQKYVLGKLDDKAGAISQVYVSRGPGGSRYFFPQEALTFRAQKPLVTTIEELGL